MVADRASFEVQVSKDGRWSTETIVYKEDEARALAKKFLADKKCEGAKIVRNWLRADGTMVEFHHYDDQSVQTPYLPERTGPG